MRGLEQVAPDEGMGVLACVEERPPGSRHLKDPLPLPSEIDRDETGDDDGDRVESQSTLLRGRLIDHDGVHVLVGKQVDDQLGGGSQFLRAGTNGISVPEQVTHGMSIVLVQPV